MKIEIQDGCYGREVFVDGVRWVDVELTEIQGILERILDKVASEKDDMELIIDLLGTVAPEICEFDDDPCDQCGHYFSKDTYEV